MAALENRTLLSTFTVLHTLDDGSNGSLRWAIGQANANPGADTVAFSAGTFAAAQTIQLTGGQLTMTDAATTTISGPAAGVSIAGPGEGQTTFRVLEIAAGGKADLARLTLTKGFYVGDAPGLLNRGTLTMSACTLTANKCYAYNQNGNTFGNGAGLFNESNATATLTNCNISGNEARAKGAGIANRGTFTLNDCTLNGNLSRDGGTAVINYAGTLTMNRSTVSGNHAQGSNGGGLINEGLGELNMIDCTVSGNTTLANNPGLNLPGDGGGLFNQGVANLTGCTFNDNFGKGGAAIYNSGNITLINSTLSDNKSDAQGFGAGLANDFGLASLVHCTITGGKVGTAGGGGGVWNSGALDIANSIVSGNELDTKGMFVSRGNNLIGATNQSTGWVASDLLGVNPNLAPLANNGGPTKTMAPSLGSLAINGGNNARVYAGLTTDQRGAGFVRIYNGTVDIGAFELQETVRPAVTINQGSGQSDPGAVSPVVFDVVFSEPVAGFTAADVALGGTAGATTKSVSGSGTTYTVSVSGMTSDGTVIATIPVGAAVDAASNLSLASASTDNTVTFIVVVPSLVVTTAVDEDNGNSDIRFGTGTSLREAIAYAKARPGADTITFATAAFPASGLTTITLGSELMLDDGAAATTIQGLGANRIAVSGNDASRVFRIATGAVTLRGLTMTHGTHFSTGGGIHLSGGAVVVVDASILSSNTATYGGAIHLDNDTASLTLTNSTIADNHASYLAGGLSVDGGTVRIVNSTFTGNTAEFGAAIRLEDDDAALTLINSTIAGNSASGSMGGIHNSNSGPLTVQNSIISLNTGGDAQNVTSTSSSLIGAANPGLELDANNHPLLKNNGGPTPTIALLPNSQAINAGSNALVPAGVTTDQRGLARIVRGTVDIGAVEAAVTTAAPVSASGGAFNYQTLQSLAFSFSSDVQSSLTNTDLIVKNLTTDQTIPASSIPLVNYVSNAATFLFTSILPDGNYRATLPAGSIYTAQGGTLTADYAFDFFVLAGDANRDRKVDFNDLVVLAQNYNLGGKTFSQGNFDYSPDGKVDFADLVILAQHYNATLPALSALVAPGSTKPTNKDEKRPVGNVLA
jgi:CSLREA domain-containing protein